MPVPSSTTRLIISVSCAAVSGFTRRWRSSWHSARAMITLRPPAAVVIASLTTFSVAPTR